MDAANHRALIAVIAAAAGATVVALLLMRRSKAKNKRRESRVKWSALVDWRGLVVESQGPADSAVAAYVVQAAKVLEEVGRFVEMKVRVGELTLEVAPQEEGLYRVVAR